MNALRLLPIVGKQLRTAFHSLFLFTPILLLVGCEGQAGPKAATPPPPPEVLVAEVVQQDVPIYFEWIGTTEGNVNAQIRPRVQGSLQSRDYREGSLVKAGQLMFAIDPREYQAALNQAMGDLRRAEANLGKTQLDVARYTPLAKEGAISQQELDNAVQAHQANKASVEAVRATVERAELNLSWTKVTAPINGIAGISVAQIGDLVTPNTILTTISQVDPIKVYYPISEQEYLHFARRIREIEEGRGGATGALELTLADGSVYPERGTFSLADRQVDLRTGTITVQSVFPNPENILRPGQYAKIRVAAETRKGAMLVPQKAVQQVQGGNQVAVVGAENKIDLRSVKVGEQVGNMWIIKEGLKPGERVVVEGVQKVRAGVTVNPKPSAAQPTPAQAGTGSPSGT
ncbi:MAG: efflux RND transporter periplasmic adaptor subunit [Deltaproteobacteria bacterium]|nr:efflux RND transporter periplasmic adaptor subunit [Deltaproteobacteria bacterium]